MSDDHDQGQVSPDPSFFRFMQGLVFRPAWLILMMLTLTTLLLSGCATHQRNSPPGPENAGDAAMVWPDLIPDHHQATRAGCNLPQGEVRRGSNLTVALTDSVSSGHAPVPHNRAERLVFAQLYETLVRVDCQGRLLPGLASGWTCTADSSTWVFTLRENAYFWDGTRVTSTDVLAAWTRAQDQGNQLDPWSWLDTHTGTIKALSGRRLAISLPEPQVDFPFLLAHPATAVAVRRQGWLWPVGSGPARLTAGTPEPLPNLTCTPNPHHPRGPRWRTLTFACHPLADPRDLINEPWDLLPVSTLPATDFFSGLPAFELVALPLNQTYLLLMPPDRAPTKASPWWPDLQVDDLHLATTTVAWSTWDRLVIPGPASSFCPQLLGPLAARRAAPLAWNLAAKNLGDNSLVYPANDPGAKQLAEFLAARTPRIMRLQPLASEPLEFVLQWQMVGAGILALEQEYPTGCLQLASLLGSIGWLQSFLPEHTGDQDPVVSLVNSGAVHPLGATHSWLVTRRGLIGLKLSYDGVPWLENWGWDPQASAGPTVRP